MSAPEAAETASIDSRYESSREYHSGTVDSGQIRQFYGNDYSGALAKGDLAATMAWSGDIVQLQADNKHLKWNLPDTGGDIWTDNMLIPKGGDVYTASVYMNFAYDPKIAAEIEDYVNYICPVLGAKQALEKMPRKFSTRVFPGLRLANARAARSLR